MQQEKDWRNKTWMKLDQPWDIIVVGGGITGAGIFREAVRLGLKTLLVEQRDFAWGTSSRSSKLVHGGLRYLKEGRFMLTRHSVLERQRLLEEGPGLIDPLGFLLVTYKGESPGRWSYSAGLSVYDLLALQWSHEHYSAEDFQMLAPHIAREGLKGGFRYGDAQTDDARLVMRVISEAAADGGTALNYVAAEKVLLENGRVTGVRLRDKEINRSVEIRARVVINAAGAWADRLRGQVGGQPRIRPLRGSHLVFPHWRLPVAQAVTFVHPIDGRLLFIFPWEGITIVGTTDLDHDKPLMEEPAVSAEETAYLMAAVEAQFPSLDLNLNDVISSFSGVRPVIGSGKADPSKESRDHVVWEENGLLTVTGGKMTTFRLIALDALSAVRHRFPHLPPLDDSVPVLDPVDVDLPGAGNLPESARRRLLGRYAACARDLVSAAKPEEMKLIPGTQTLWAELRWAARAESVVHLDDLLLRRVRIGLFLPGGGADILPQIRALSQPELGWDDARWDKEEAAYLELWKRCYSLPDAGSVPDWKAMLVEARSRKQAKKKSFRRRLVRSFAAGVLISLSLSLLYLSRKK